MGPTSPAGQHRKDRAGKLDIDKHPVVLGVFFYCAPGILYGTRHDYDGCNVLRIYLVPGNNRMCHHMNEYLKKKTPQLLLHRKFPKT